jgi:hypothetical protein
MDKTIKYDPQARVAAEAALAQYKEERRKGAAKKALKDVRFCYFDSVQFRWVMRIGRESYSISI